MRLLYVATIAVSLISLLGQAARAEGQETRGPDGFPTGIIRNSNGVLHTKDGIVVKFSCSPPGVLESNEVDATTIGAPACAQGLVATEWYCLAKDVIAPKYRPGPRPEEGQPTCDAQHTANRVPLFDPQRDALPMPKRPPPLVPGPSNRNGDVRPLGYVAPPQASPTSNFHYVTAAQTVVATEINGTFSVGKPYTSPIYVPATQTTTASANGHSLAQIGAMTLDQQQTVEFGWTVDPRLAGDYQPRIFVNRAVNGNYITSTSNNCYNSAACGFVPVNNSKNIKAGNIITPGSSHEFAIIHLPAQGSTPSRWDCELDGVDLGYYPDTVWSNAAQWFPGSTGVIFTQAKYLGWWGEIYQGDPTPTNTTIYTPTTAMGNGEFGTNPSSSVANIHAATISAMQYTAAANGVLTTPADSSWNIVPTDPPYYDASSVVNGQFNYGGPGAAASAAYVPAFTVTQSGSTNGWGWVGGTSAISVVDEFANTAGLMPPATPFTNAPYGWLSSGQTLSPDGSTLFVEECAEGPPPQPGCDILVVPTAPSDQLGAPTAIAVTNNPSTPPIVSPDGNTLYYYPFNASTVSTLQKSGTGWAPGPTLANAAWIYGVSNDSNTVFALSPSATSTLEAIGLAVGTGGATFTNARFRNWVAGQPRTGYALSPDLTGIYFADQTGLFKVNTTISAAGKVTFAAGPSFSWPSVSVPGTASGEISLAMAPDSSRIYASWDNIDPSTGLDIGSVVSAINPATGQAITANGLTNPITLPTQGTTGETLLSMSTDGSTLYAMVSDIQFNVNTGENGIIVYKINTATGGYTATQMIPGWSSAAFGNFGGGRAAVRRVAAGRR